jgi:hypothetical protein
MQNTNPATNTLYARVSFKQSCGARYIAIAADLYEHNSKPLYFETLSPADVSMDQINLVLARLQKRSNTSHVLTDIKKDVIKLLDKNTVDN